MKGVTVATNVATQEATNGSAGRVAVRVGAVQLVSQSRDVDGNVERALAYCDRAARRGVQILCFPECASTGFDWLADPAGAGRVHAEPVPGPLVERFAAKARETGVYIIMGVVERAPGSAALYNTAFLVGPDEGYIGRHRKILSESVFHDGTDAEVFPTRYGKIGIFICADMRSPELCRLLALKGANLLFQPTNYFHADGLDVRRRYLGKVASQRARAMDNGLHLIVANAGRPEYVNNSRILTPVSQGPEVALARATRKEQLLVADVDFDPGQNTVLQQARRSPWLFAALGREMLAAAGADAIDATGRGAT
jgi:predicted amidohydrolase